MRVPRMLAMGMAAALALTGVVPAATAQATSRVPEVPDRYLSQEIDWSTCTFDRQIKQAVPEAPTTNCADITVPMDWHNPDDHSDITIAVSRSEATGDRQGALWSNPGGPGGAGLTLSAALGIDRPRLFSDFDLIGFDPRGFGQSTRLTCPTTLAELNALPSTPDNRVRDAVTHRAEQAEAALLAKACGSTEFAPFVSTEQTVYDMEFLRQLLAPDSDLNFIGYSYGTWIGAWYADLYPRHVGRMVFDSNMEWTTSHEDNANLDPMSGQRRRDLSLFPWIARHEATYGLGGTTAEVTVEYERIRAGLVESGSNPVQLDQSLYSGSYGNARFTQVAETIVSARDAVDGPSTAAAADWRSPMMAAGSSADRATTLVIDHAVQAADADATINLGSQGIVVRCNDSRYVTDSRWQLRQADRNAARYPFFGYMNGVPTCTYWDHAPRHDRKVSLSKDSDVLMIQSEADPATAYEGGLRSHRRNVHRSTMISVNDEGQHGIYIGGPSTCVEEIGDAYLFEGVVPRATVCGTSPLPGDTQVYPIDGPVRGPASAHEQGGSITRMSDPTPSLAREIIDRANGLE